VVVRLHLSELPSVVESAIDVKCLDFELKAIDEAKKFCEDVAGGIGVSDTIVRKYLPV